MIGFLRFGLALIVMASHLGAISDILARLSVLLFYALAGYFGTFSMIRLYKGRGAAFSVSRWVRVWPSYAVLFLVSSLAMLVWTPRLEAMGLPVGRQWFAQLFLLPTGVSPLNLHFVVAPAWMLPHMLLWWGAIALGIAATSTRAWVWLGVTMGLLVGSQAWPWTDWYFSPLYAGPWFAVGAVAYHLGLRTPRDGRWAAWAGALSYPVFLSHYAIGSAIPILPGWPLFLASLPLTLLLSWLLVILIERPVARYRNTLRTS